MRFLTGQPTVIPTIADYDPLDQGLVVAQAAKLSQMGGDYHAALDGSAKFLKVDIALNAKNYLSLRGNTSKFEGANNVFFDPGNPVTNSPMSSNGEETVRTDSLLASLTSTLSERWMSHARLQFSRDLEQSFANSTDARTKIYGIVDGFGRSTMLPRETREHRFHAAETLSYANGRNDWKIGVDALLTWDYNYFPSMYGGEFEFDNIRVNPWTFAPMTYGERLTPLRAYAHNAPRYYMQSFGSAVSHPDSREYAAFAQDSLRLTSHLGVSLGVRYDLQTYPSNGLQVNPIWPTSGKLPSPKNDFAPRVAVAYAFGDHKPLMVRAGYGWFYTRIPQIYESSVQTGSGLGQSFLFLDAQQAAQGRVFPT
jgi:outer membrane receptor protein involved in Fe transport